MANIFISYNRQNEPVARTLADDIKALGHDVWFDQELSGGQAWWDKILSTVRDCDVFIFVLDKESLDSVACKREYGYAADLGKSVLPILVSGEVPTNLLPPALSQIQYIDYRNNNREAALRLAKAIYTISPPPPLPDPLPPPPEVPISYMARLTEQIEATSTMSFEEQSKLVIELKSSLRDPSTSTDGRKLLGRMRRRRDLFATVADEIDEVLQSQVERQRVSPPGTYSQKPARMAEIFKPAGTGSGAVRGIEEAVELRGTEEKKRKTDEGSRQNTAQVKVEIPAAEAEKVREKELVDAKSLAKGQRGKEYLNPIWMTGGKAEKEINHSEYTVSTIIAFLGVILVLSALSFCANQIHS